CLLSAGFANRRDGFFYLGFLALAGWALAVVRPRRYSPVSWAAMLSAAAVLGFGGHQGLHRLQQYLELKGMEFFAEFRGLEGDPFQTITGIGDIARRKPSGRVVFRVRPLENVRSPMLLREASYNRYHDGRWFAMGSRFQPVPPQSPGDRWALGDRPSEMRRIQVLTPLAGRRTLLKLPTGSWRVDDLPVSFLERNELGAVRAGDGPGLLGYRVSWGTATPLDDPPRAEDREVPEEEAPAIRELVGRLELSGLAPDEAGARLDRFFLENFQYDLGARHRKAPTHLADFLTRNRAGHCEYFAGAAVLLMRAAGIPARYAVGYSVHEFNAMENALVARDRHAHAWAIYWNGERWRDLDATPPDWRPMESELASPWERLSDLWSWIGFRFQSWRWRPDQEGLPVWTLWFALPLVLFLLRRLAKKRRFRRPAGKAAATGNTAPRPGADSPFYEIERRLTMWGHARRPGEPLGRWVDRLAETPAVPEVPHDLLRLHYRYRFGPEGLPPQARERLEAGVRDWLARTPEGPPPAV
ncbi:MAG: transglutaminase-like domain-containing protein, partial [Desulfococcaceae bacterium]